MRRPDLMAAFYQKELEISGEPQFLYEVTIPFPHYVDVSFHGAWESVRIPSDNLEFVKAEPLAVGVWAVYIRLEFWRCEEMPVLRILLREDADGIVFKKIRITEHPFK